MPDTTSHEFSVSLSDIDKLFELVEKTVAGFKNLSAIPENERNRVRDALIETTELIDSILLSVKLALTDTIDLVRNDNANAAQAISNLADTGAWEDQYRHFRLCWPLRKATSELRESVLDRLTNFFSFKNTDQLKAVLDSYLATEASAGELVSRMLRDLSKLGSEVGSRKDYVLQELETAKDAIHDCRKKFIDLEIKISDAL
jgi:hypothetical protein